MTGERLDYLAWVEAQAARGTPYCWPDARNGYTGKGLHNPREPEALDCSGIVTCGLYNATHGRLDWRADYNAARLFLELKPTDVPRPGDLCFYGGPGRITHVMTWVGDGQVVGASGGNRDTLSVEIARRIGARVKYRKSHLYRPDFRGFRQLPVP
jgi:cell wall-associated NlpC family hydrolase